MSVDIEDIESGYRFANICAGFYNLAGGLLKLHNAHSGIADGAIVLLLTAHKKIIDDFMSAPENPDT